MIGTVSTTKPSSASVAKKSTSSTASTASQETTTTTASYQQLDGRIVGLELQDLTQQIKSASQFEEIMKTIAALIANST